MVAVDTDVVVRLVTQDHPAQAAYRETVADMFGVPNARLITGLDGCGVLTYAFPLRDVARVYAMLADPGAIPPSDPRAPLAKHLYIVRDAMLAHPELVAGSRERLDTSLMKAVPGRVFCGGNGEQSFESMRPRSR